MILPQFFGRSRRAGTIDALYGMIVAQARLPVFYREYGVPDTVDGRFDLIVLHLALFVRRTAGGASSLQQLGQAVFDAFCLDMDENLREMGVGDLAVAKQMQHVGSAFYGRYRAYEEALADGAEDVLTGTLARNVYGTDASAAAKLAIYIKDAADCLARQDNATLENGRIAFPDPASQKKGA